MEVSSLERNKYRYIFEILKNGLHKNKGHTKIHSD